MQDVMVQMDHRRVQIRVQREHIQPVVHRGVRRFLRAAMAVQVQPARVRIHVRLIQPARRGRHLVRRVIVMLDMVVMQQRGRVLIVLGEHIKRPQAMHLVQRVAPIITVMVGHILKHARQRIHFLVLGPLRLIRAITT